MKSLFATFAICFIAGSAISMPKPEIKYCLTIGGSRIDILPSELLSGTPIPASATSTGRRTYEPLVFRKRIDKSSPLLELFKVGAKWPTATMEKLEKGRNGIWRQLAKVKYENVRVQSVAPSTNNNFHIAVTFQKIIVN